MYLQQSIFLAEIRNISSVFFFVKVLFFILIRSLLVLHRRVKVVRKINQSTNGPVNAHLISWQHTRPGKYMVRVSFSFFLKVFIQSFVQINIVVSEKIQFEILHDHDLQYSHIFIYSIRCLLPLLFR